MAKDPKEEKKGWRITINVTEEYLSGKQGFSIIETTLKSDKSKTYKKMYGWCEENIQGSWSVASYEMYNFFITFRMWDEEKAKKFVEKFSKYIKKS